MAGDNFIRGTVTESGTGFENGVVIAVQHPDVADLSKSEAREITAIATLSDGAGSYEFNSDDLIEGLHDYHVIAHAVDGSNELVGDVQYAHYTAGRAYQFALATGASTTYLHNTTEWGEDQALTDTDNRIPDVAFSDDGVWFAVSDWDNNRVLIYQRSDGAWTSYASLDIGYIPISLDYSVGSEYLAIGKAGSGEDEVDVYDVTSDYTVDATLTQAGQNIESVAFGDAGNYLGYSSVDNNAYIHQTDGSWTAEQTISENVTIKDIAFSPDGDYFATASADDSLRIYYIPNSWAQIEGEADSLENLNAVDFSPGSGLVATASDDGTVYVYENTASDNWDNHDELLQATEPVTDVHWSRAQPYIGYSSEDGSVYIHETEIDLNFEQEVSTTNEGSIQTFEFSKV